eukprot:COSAG05_NODE_1629_length_4372_cov_4.107653_6_plen_161_part_00
MVRPLHTARVACAMCPHLTQHRREPHVRQAKSDSQSIESGPVENFLRAAPVASHIAELVGVKICHGLKVGQQLLKVAKLSKKKKQYIHGTIIHIQSPPDGTDAFEITAAFKDGPFHARFKAQRSMLVNWRTVYNQEGTQPDTPPFDLTHAELCDAWYVLS